MKIKNSLPLDNNIYSLKLFSELLIKKNIEHCIFFGSLLGVTRDNALIEGDDDVDFYVNLKEREKVIAILDDLSVQIDFSKKPNNSSYFIQADFEHRNKRLRVDFYFYESDIDDNYIYERWNFEAKPKYEQFMLKIPKVFIYPLNKIESNYGCIYMPAHPELICEYLYGSRWKTPLKKNQEYQVRVMGGKPYMFYINHEQKKLELLP